MLTASVENMLVTSIDTTLETGVVPTQYIVIISTVRRQSEVGIQRWIDVGPIVNFCLGSYEKFPYWTGKCTERFSTIITRRKIDSKPQYLDISR